MSIKELREKSVDALLKQLRELNKKLVLLRVEVKTGQLKKVREIRATRKLIATIKTILREKEIASQVAL